jgi:hypothetical protein
MTLSNSDYKPAATDHVVKNSRIYKQYLESGIDPYAIYSPSSILIISISNIAYSEPREYS